VLCTVRRDSAILLTFPLNAPSQRPVAGHYHTSPVVSRPAPDARCRAPDPRCSGARVLTQICPATAAVAVNGEERQTSRPLGLKDWVRYRLMKFITRLLIVLVILLLVGGTIALATWDMPAPTATREKVIPNERFR